MTEPVIFYTNPMSRGRSVRWMLEEIGQPYQTEIITYGPEMKSPAYLAINPMGKVPAIRHGDTIVTEASAIIAYLADAFPEAELAPPVTDTRRGAYYRWLFFAAGPVEAAIINKALNFVCPPDREAMVGYGTLTAVTDTLEQAVSTTPYLLGEHFSAADLYVGASLYFGLKFKTVEARPALAAYCDRIYSRAAATRATQIDDALMPPRPDA